MQCNVGLRNNTTPDARRSSCPPPHVPRNFSAPLFQFEPPSALGPVLLSPLLRPRPHQPPPNGITARRLPVVGPTHARRTGPICISCNTFFSVYSSHFYTAKTRPGRRAATVFAPAGAAPLREPLQERFSRPRAGGPLPPLSRRAGFPGRPISYLFLWAMLAWNRIYLPFQLWAGSNLAFAPLQRLELRFGGASIFYQPFWGAIPSTFGLSTVFGPCHKNRARCVHDGAAARTVFPFSRVCLPVSRPKPPPHLSIIIERFRRLLPRSLCLPSLLK
jgi:hypothetical protein